MGRLIIYEGTAADDEIRKYLSSLMVQGQAMESASPVASGAANGTRQKNVFDQIAQAFCARIAEVAATGLKGQYNAMAAWLKNDGMIELSQLWKASGVKNQHDYGGIGSSLTRNMKKAGGMKQWYSGERHPNKAHEWIYKINPELVEPLKRAFGI